MKPPDLLAMQDSKPAFSPLGTKAYGLFFEELPKQIASGERVLSAEAPASEDLKQMAGCFHTIKGGAGFFGLKTVYELASRLEELLVSETSQNLVEAKKLFEEFQREAAKLPEPK